VCNVAVVVMREMEEAKKKQRRGRIGYMQRKKERSQR
jgi:hypothetical protein